MSLSVIFVLGIIFGSVISNILFYSRTSKGTIIINKKGPEDTEIVDVLIPDIGRLYKKRKLSMHFHSSYNHNRNYHVLTTYRRIPESLFCVSNLDFPYSQRFLFPLLPILTCSFIFSFSPDTIFIL